VPTYGYRCQKCGEDFDVRQRMSDEPKADCPACGGAGKRQFFPAGIVFKGGGFYKTDSRKSSSDGASTSTSKKSDKAKDSGSKSDSVGSTSTGSGTSSSSSSAAAAAAD